MPNGKNARAGFAACAGRLICDVKISAKELVRMKDYDLTALAREQIPINDDQANRFANRREYGPADIQKAYERNGDFPNFRQKTVCSFQKPNFQ